VVTILNVAAGVTTFDLLWVMASDFPGKRTLSLAVYMYYESFGKGAWAYGAAVAVVLGSIVILVSAFLAVVQSRVTKRIQ
jgi:multiple sugar transport system permease protein